MVTTGEAASATTRPQIRPGTEESTSEPTSEKTKLTTSSASSSSQKPGTHVGSGGLALAATASPNVTIATNRRSTARNIGEEVSTLLAGARFSAAAPTGAPRALGRTPARARG